jgi:hypothetical protein
MIILLRRFLASTFSCGPVAGGILPSWVPDLARDTWQVQLSDDVPVGGNVLVREASPLGYGRASWKINLGCNYPIDRTNERHAIAKSHSMECSITIFVRDKLC